MVTVEYLGHYGDDNSIAENARVSFNSSEKDYTDEQNQNLIKYLARGLRTKEHDEYVNSVVNSTKEEADKLLRDYRKIPTHWVPFAHTFIKLVVNAPTNIRTQCFKHKAGLSESEVSRRYITSTPEVFVPDFFRMKAVDVKQGSGDIHPENFAIKTAYIEQTKQAVAMYEDFIRRGVCPEQARFVLPQGMEVKWVWSGNLYAFANFYIARSDSHAQKEVQEVAKQVDSIIRPLFPIAWSYLVD